MFRIEMQNKVQVGQPTNGDSLDEAIISDLVSFHLRKKRIRLEEGFRLPEINSL
jgi:hypothetical protein